MVGERTEIARKLRRQETEAERKLWTRLRNRQLGGMKFRRQVPLFGFYADFFCEDAKLIVEVDGAQHSERTESDKRRTEMLQDAGYHVLRFWNNEVLTNIEGVSMRIAEAAHHTERKTQSLTPHPVPLPQGEGDPYNILMR